MDKEEWIAGRCKPEGSRDNGKMITSLLPLMSVLTLARVPALDDMCTDIIWHILQVHTSALLLCTVSSISFPPLILSPSNYLFQSVLRIQLILMRIRILDPHWKKMDPDPDPNPDPDADPGYFFKIYWVFLTKQNFKIFCLIFFAYFFCLFLC